MLSVICRCLKVNDSFVWSQIELIQSLLLGKISVTEFYASSYPFTSAFLFHVVLMVYVFIVGTYTNDHSQVDRMWSILPATTVLSYLGHTYLVHDTVSARQLLYTGAVVIWSVRLTFNFARKGGYNGMEDYRWAILRSLMPKWLFVCFNLVFISIVQLLILLNITAPAALFTEYVHVSMSSGEYSFLAAIIGAITIESLADQEMWIYQSAKSQYRATGEVPDGFTKAQMERGFCTIGLFAYSRHPNFLAEQLVWATPYLWTFYLSDTQFNWTIIGAIGYVILFQGSTTFTEIITRKKYPTYEGYQKVTGKLFPSFITHWTEPVDTEAKDK